MTIQLFFETLTRGKLIPKYMITRNLYLFITTLILSLIGELAYYAASEWSLNQLLVRTNLPHLSIIFFYYKVALLRPKKWTEGESIDVIFRERKMAFRHFLLFFFFFSW